MEMQKLICEELGFKFRVINMPINELGFSANKKFDVEVYLPKREIWGEVASITNCTDFQSRRLNIKYVNKTVNNKKQRKFVHTINGTGIATSRILLALLEYYYDPETKVLTIPKPLREYVHMKQQIQL